MIRDEADVNLRITAYNLALTDPARPTPQSSAEVVVLHPEPDGVA